MYNDATTTFLGNIPAGYAGLNWFWIDGKNYFRSVDAVKSESSPLKALAKEEFSGRMFIYVANFLSNPGEYGFSAPEASSIRLTSFLAAAGTPRISTTTVTVTATHNGNTHTASIVLSFGAARQVTRVDDMPNIPEDVDSIIFSGFEGYLVMDDIVLCIVSK